MKDTKKLLDQSLSLTRTLNKIAKMMAESYGTAAQAAGVTRKELSDIETLVEQLNSALVRAQNKMSVSGKAVSEVSATVSAPHQTNEGMVCEPEINTLNGCDVVGEDIYVAYDYDAEEDDFSIHHHLVTTLAGNLKEGRKYIGDIKGKKLYIIGTYSECNIYAHEIVALKNNKFFKRISVTAIPITVISSKDYGFIDRATALKVFNLLEARAKSLRNKASSKAVAPKEPVSEVPAKPAPKKSPSKRTPKNVPKEEETTKPIERVTDNDIIKIHKCNSKLTAILKDGKVCILDQAGNIIPVKLEDDLASKGFSS